MKKKKWWYVTGTATVTAYRFVRAETEEAAIDAARNSDVALCPYGPSRSGTTPLQEAIVEEADGAFEEDEDGVVLEAPMFRFKLSAPAFLLATTDEIERALHELLCQCGLREGRLMTPSLWRRPAPPALVALGRCS